MWGSLDSGVEETTDLYFLSRVWAWFPIKLDDGSIRWWDEYYAGQVQQQEVNTLALYPGGKKVNMHPEDYMAMKLRGDPVHVCPI